MISIFSLYHQTDICYTHVISLSNTDPSEIFSKYNYNFSRNHTSTPKATITLKPQNSTSITESKTNPDYKIIQYTYIHTYMYVLANAWGPLNFSRGINI